MADWRSQILSQSGTPATPGPAVPRTSNLLQTYPSGGLQPPGYSQSRQDLAVPQTARTEVSVHSNPSLKNKKLLPGRSRRGSVTSSYSGTTSAFHHLDQERKVVRKKLQHLSKTTDDDEEDYKSEYTSFITDDLALAETGGDHWKFKDKFKYEIEEFMVRHPITQLILLLTIFLIQNVFGGFIYYFVTKSEYSEEDQPTYTDVVWLAWTFMADPGTEAPVSGTRARVVAALITIGGILYFAVVVGYVVDAVSVKVENLKKGKTSVVEKNHILIIGWTDKTIPLVKELCMAADSEGGDTIVIMAPIEKEEMEREFVSSFKREFYLGSTVIFRKGNGMLGRDLLKVSAFDARTIIVLASTGDPDKADAEVLRTMLSLKGLKFKLQGFVVAELRDLDNASLVEMVGGELCETIVSHDLVGRLMIQASREPGLAGVYQQTLGFEGSEFYYSQWDELTGKTFEDAIWMFPTAIPLGVKEPGKRVVLNPPGEFVIKKDTEVLFLAEDDDTYWPEDAYFPDPPPFEILEEEPQKPEFLLLCGWRRDVDDILVLLDNLLPKGSLVHMLATVPIAKREQLLLDGGLDVSMLQNIGIRHLQGNSAMRYRLEQLPIEKYTSICIMADSTLEENIVHCDSHSISTLLLVRDIAIQRRKKTRRRKGEAYMRRKAVWKNLSTTRLTDQAVHIEDAEMMIICEILDSRTRQIVQANEAVAGIADFMLSNELISMTLAMVAYKREVKQVLEELTSIDGATLTVRAATMFVAAGELLNFWEMQFRVREREYIAIGYKLDADTHVVLNPCDKTKPICWGPLDFVFLLKKSSRSYEDTSLNKPPDANELVRRRDADSRNNEKK